METRILDFDIRRGIPDSLSASEIAAGRVMLSPNVREALSGILAHMQPGTTCSLGGQEYGFGYLDRIAQVQNKALAS